MAGPTKEQLQERLAEAQAQLADTRPQVIVSLHGVLADMPEIAKRRVQSFQAFHVDDVYATLRPLLVKHALVIVPAVRSVEYDHGTFQKGTEFIDARIVVDYTVMSAIDGSTLRMTGAAEGRDTQDKATNKALQQAFKYALIQLLLINTGDDAEDDPGKGERAVAQPAQPELTPEQISEKLTNAAKAKLYELITDNLGKDSTEKDRRDEAGRAWPLVLERAGIETITTKAEKQKVIDAAVALFDEDAAPFDADPASKQ